MIRLVSCQRTRESRVEVPLERVPSARRRRKRPPASWRLASTACGGLASLVLAACGGHAVTKQDVIAQGNAICAGALRDLRAIPPPAGGETSLPALAADLRSALPIVQGEVSSLRALPRPAEDRALLDRYVAAMTSSLSAYRSLAAAAQRGDQTGVDRALAALQTNPAPKLAGRYGLSQCASAEGTAVSGG
ncbi:MAG: hypothetical protein JO372_23505 [Solirubrobacterales bacterium]|nr:hypothetical protein [Solirubrobacterales bacterium]